MTPDQHNHLIANARSLMSDAKWVRTASPDARRWAEWWARMAPREVDKAVTA